MRWQEAVASWKQTLRSPYTQHSFEEAVKSFFVWAGMDLEDVGADLLESYVRYLTDRTNAVPKTHDRRITWSTVNKYFEGQKLFFRFCIKNGWLHGLTVEEIDELLKKWPASVSIHYEILSREERETLLNATATMRDKCIIALGLYAGLRNFEICNLRAGDIGKDQGGCYVRVERGKGNKSADVPIDDRLYLLLRAYAEGKAPDALMWKIHPDRAREMVKRTARRANIQRRITPHSLRHTYAYWLARDGTPLDVVSKLLRHSSLAITTVYISHLTREETARYAPAFPG